MLERKLESDRYRCDTCGEEFLRCRSDEEAVAESDARFGSAHRDWAVVCDVCFQQGVKREQMLRDLQRDLYEEVVAGNMTDDEANAYFTRKADQWEQDLGVEVSGV